MRRLVNLMFKTDDCMKYAIKLGDAIESEKELSTKLFKNKDSYYWILPLCKDDDTRSKYYIKIKRISETRKNLICMECELNDYTLSLLPEDHIMDINAIYDDINNEIIGFIFKGTSNNFYMKSITNNNCTLSYISISMNNFIHNNFSPNFYKYIPEYISNFLIDKLKYIVNTGDVVFPTYIVFITDIEIRPVKGIDTDKIIYDILYDLYNRLGDSSNVLYIKYGHVYSGYTKYLKFPTLDTSHLYIRLIKNNSAFIKLLFHKCIEDCINENLNKITPIYYSNDSTSEINQD